MSRLNWDQVAQTLECFADTPPTCKGMVVLDEGQRASVRELASRIRGGKRMALLADEVGMGKTRIAVALVEAVRHAGGRCAIVIPPGVGPQWQAELKCFNSEDETLLPLRSYESFIAGYQRAEDTRVYKKKYIQERRSKRLTDRRAQRELPSWNKCEDKKEDKTWADEEILMISHNFARMRFSKWGRRHLIGQVKGYLEAGDSAHRPRGDTTTDMANKRAADAIAKSMRAANLELPSVRNPKGLPADEYKQQVLPLIGYGLGKFDLIVVDEVHKTRGQDSSLSRILGPVTWESDDPFRLGMTATPVELDAGQWLDIIERISGRDDGADVALVKKLKKPITDYVEVVKRLQREELDEELVAAFEAAARKFEKKLRRYVLRRDKRDDPEIAPYVETYRHVCIRYVTPTDDRTGFTRDWLRRFAAFEALSHLPQSGRHLKRLRLSVPQGLGLGAIDDLKEADEEDCRDEDPAINLWLDAIGNLSEETDLYTHPAITTAVNLIESYTNNNEKVLVFGRFTAPIMALTQLLDAREMLRRLSDPNGYWPASGIPENNVPAVKSALRDPEIWRGSHDLRELRNDIATRYETRRAEREKNLDQLHEDLVRMGKTLQQDHHAQFLLERWHRGDNARGFDAPEISIGSLLEALEARLPVGESANGNGAVRWNAAIVLEQFKELVGELSNDDEIAENNGKMPPDLDARLASHLSEYSGREGNFARRMWGGTGAQAKRNLQSAFNRQTSWPKVLIAQSQVGREGLNLHRACRTVVLLHSEWNPAVVEQQIGRVDRKESLWIDQLRKWQDRSGQPGEMPRIMIHPIVVQGTYDDHNWQVLDARWRALRGQLHGSVLSPAEGKQGHNMEKLRARIRDATPRFSPARRTNKGKGE
jgi:superfamily II DNA or RNA helicase